MKASKKTFGNLAARLRSIRRKPLSPAQIDGLNKIFDKDREEERKNPSQDGGQKIARAAEIQS